MIYEFRTYTFKPGTLAEMLRRWEPAYARRRAYSELAAFWSVEIGPLNQTVQVWPYADLAERARIRAQCVADGAWPPPIHEFLLHMLAEIFVPFPCSPALGPGKLGPFFELRRYRVRPGQALAQIQERWAAKLPERTALSPLAFVGSTEVGGLSEFLHIWPYPSLDERARIRRHAVQSGAWPPPGGPEALLAQENKILVPVSFSPLQ
jgi:NIPSNAP